MFPTIPYMEGRLRNFKGKTDFKASFTFNLLENISAKSKNKTEDAVHSSMPGKANTLRK